MMLLKLVNNAALPKTDGQPLDAEKCTDSLKLIL